MRGGRGACWRWLKPWLRRSGLTGLVDERDGVAEAELDEVGVGEVAEGGWGEGRGGVAVDCGVVRLEMGVVEMGVSVPTTPLLLARDWAAVLRTFALVVRKMVFGFLTTLRFAIVVELVGCRRTRRSR